VAVERDTLIGRWRHSHEEDSDDQLVFRRDDYDFPLSRGRRSLELRDDGSLVDTAVGAADVPQAGAGTWSLEDGNLVVRGPDTATYRVVAAEPDRLVLRTA
jgi:hypothetical protein